MIVRLTIQQDGAGFRATISKREDQKNTPVGVPQIFLVDAQLKDSDLRPFHRSDLHSLRMIHQCPGNLLY